LILSSWRWIAGGFFREKSRLKEACSVQSEGAVC
jgi:hypothetical protein